MHAVQSCGFSIAGLDRVSAGLLLTSRCQGGGGLLLKHFT
jgi:hypothetical protein